MTLEIAPFARIAGGERVALAEEGMRLLTFLTAGDRDDVRVSIRFLTE